MALFARELHEFILSFHIWMSNDLHILRRRHRVAYMHRRSSQRRGRHNQAMMLNDRIQSISRLQFALGKGKEYLSKLPPDTPISDFEYKFQELGFEKGWGDNGHVSEMVHLLLDILQVPDPSTLETFLGRIPLVFNVVILSPHGYFGQANVLGLSDTGGQKRMLVALELMIQGAEESDASKSGNDLI